MKIIFLLGALAFVHLSYSQTTIEFTELNYGVAKTEKSDAVKSENLPTGHRNISSTLEFIEHTDSIHLASKSSFGIMYILKAVDSVDINIEIEWIFPRKMVDNTGKKYRSIRYTTQKPTNTELGNTYTFDEPYELIPGNWTLNLYFEKKKLFSRTFFVYN